MPKKRGKARKKVKKRSKKKILLFLVIIIFTISVASYFGLHELSQNTKTEKGTIVRKAAIIDGLSEDIPNPSLINEMSNLLRSSGYEVTIFNGSQVNIELFRNLPEMGFTLIIMRLHGGRIQQPIGLFIGSGLFAEPFSEGKYEYEYYSGYFLKGVAYVGGKEYFVITPAYVSEKFQGRFPGSAIIILSCYSMWDQVLASSFIEKGASIVVGIDHKTDVQYLDRVGLELVKQISQGASVEEAVSKTMEIVGPDPLTGAKLLYVKGG
ncbi:MAG: hypothetical protein NDF52_07540 [archaeon YNP-WB-062]|jgi:hypothetical protein|nr:hypothetical protein [Candidatus Culexarchaeum yellowstonense]